ncbi:MAG: DUF3656 domain-containing protein [Anaerotardibacter sp.]
MSELLAPAGSMDSLKAAIANGCDAVYLGMQKFGARAYSSNFDQESVKEAVEYAHLRGVKVYVTMNTIVFEDEIEETHEQLDYLNSIGVDAVIVQDLALLTYIVEHFEDMEAHCSTQMGIDDLPGVLLAEKLGAKQVVISRETPLETIKEIKEKTSVSLEAFIHGALCVSYSGNCIMSGMTGNRSGNRGRCIGSCRKLYQVFDTTTNTSLGSSYILSTKDLNTIDYVNQLDCIDSLKIEGRMKEPLYVANVVSRYRAALDEALSSEDKEKLNRTFNRTFTKGYMLGEDKKDITNIERPNHHGYQIGVISGNKKGYYEITLEQELKQNDHIRIRHKNDDVNLSVTKLFDKKGKLINSATDRCYIRLKEKLSCGDVVYKTKDKAFEKELETTLTQEYRRFPLSIQVFAYPDTCLVINASGLGEEYCYTSKETLSEAKTKPSDKALIEKQFSRLTETVFYLDEVLYEDCGAFIPAKLLNAARKEIVEALYQKKLASKKRRLREPQPHHALSFKPQTAFLSASVTTQEQYEACQKAGIQTIYFENIIPRNNCTYPEKEGLLLIGGMGGVWHYGKTNPFVTDYSFNVVNAESVYQLHNLGASRVTLSYEINENQIKQLLESYQEQNQGTPSLELIVYGRAPLLVTKYCPLKTLDKCSLCKKHTFEIKDNYGSFPLLFHDNCDVTVLNGKTLNLLDEIPHLSEIEAFRLNFTTESAEEVSQIIAWAKGKLENTDEKSVFRPEVDTRGYFNKEIL